MLFQKQRVVRCAAMLPAASEDKMKRRKYSRSVRVRGGSGHQKHSNQGQNNAQGKESAGDNGIDEK